MTHEQIDRIVRQANPVPDLKALEPVDASVLVLEKQRRTEMQTHDRVEVDQDPEKPRYGTPIGIAAAAAIVIGVLILFRPGGNAPVAAEPTAVEIATAFVEAFGAFDVDRAASYLAAEADVSLEGGSDLRLESRSLETHGFKLLFDSCEAQNDSPSGTLVRCAYDYHGIRSDEIGLGPYSGSWFDITVLEGEIVSVSDHIQFMSNGFSSEMWEPFAAWVAEAHPEDVAVMYTDSSQTMAQITEESNRLWEQRSREYVDVARDRAEAESIATGFVEAFGAFDVDRAASYLAAEADVSLEGGSDLRLESRSLETHGFKLLFDSCEAQNDSPSGTLVRCAYDYHGIRSDEIGLGPYSGSWFDITVLEGEIVSVSDHIQFMSNGFSSEMWEPFAAWVAEAHPEDVAVMYTDSSQTMAQITEESNRLWEQRSREYVDVVGP